MRADYLLHFVAGVLIGFVFAFIHPAVGIMAAIAAGVAKETYDLATKDEWDWNDILWTNVGGAMGTAFAVWVMK